MCGYVCVVYEEYSRDKGGEREKGIPDRFQRALIEPQIP